MNHLHTAVSDDGELPWSSDGHSIDSDDGLPSGLPQSPWIASLSNGSISVSASSTMSFARTGQLSPISNDMEAPCTTGSSTSASSSCSPPVTAMAHQGQSSACAGSWHMGYADAHEAADATCSGESHEMNWEHCSNDALTIPKLEPVDDDDFRLDDVKEAPFTPELGAGDGSLLDQPKTKRPRGRPRKHPLTPNIAANKITKGRSKTGCLTCRKRKKKCDEAKPRCMNCEKNAVVCEGYPEKQIWKSGKERAEEERLRSHSLPSITMQPIFYGLDTVEDRIFWKHYNERLSTVLTVEGEHKNAFKDMMVPIAVKHQGLMHSILSLASKHIDFEAPYGLNILRDNPTTTLQALQERSIYHHDQARLKFYADVEEKPGTDHKILVSARYGQMLCFLLEALAEGNPRGEHRLHLSAYQNLISSSPPDNTAFLSFIAEYFQYHIFADELIHSAIRPSCQPSPKELPPTPPIHPPRLLGVADGLLDYLSQITAIRNTIRTNIINKADDVVDYMSLYRADEIDVAIREWTPHWPAGDSRNRAGLLYKQMMWIYLVRTIYPPSSSMSSTSAASCAASMSVVRNSSCFSHPSSSAVNTPPQSASTSCASSPRLVGSGNTRPNLNPQDSLGPAAGYTNTTSRPESPPPIRQPSQHDPRVSQNVDQSLAILESFKPSDPSQTLLLLPCFIIGTACFTPSQQERVRTAIKRVKGYTGLRNSDRVMDVLEEVWRLMDVGDWSAVWDWPSVSHKLGLDFIPA